MTPGVFARPMPPRPVQHGGGSECGRRIHLRQQTIANGWTLRTDVDRDAGALDQCDEASDLSYSLWSQEPVHVGGGGRNYSRADETVARSTEAHAAAVRSAISGIRR